MLTNPFINEKKRVTSSNVLWIFAQFHVHFNTIATGLKYKSIISEAAVAAAATIRSV